MAVALSVDYRGFTIEVDIGIYQPNNAVQWSYRIFKPGSDEAFAFRLFPPGHTHTFAEIEASAKQYVDSLWNRKNKNDDAPD